jgi:hypothetical protein
VTDNPAPADVVRIRTVLPDGQQRANGLQSPTRAGGVSVVLGALSALTMPLAIFATRYSGAYELLHAGLAIPIALGLGVGAVVASRQARRTLRHSLGQDGIRRSARIGWVLGTLGICLAATGTIAVAVYGLLTYVGST